MAQVEQQLFTVPEAARFLEVGETRIRRTFRRGGLKRSERGPRAVVTFERAELERFRKVLIVERKPAPTPAAA